MDASKKFVTCINCIDGRTQEPTINYLKEVYDADYIDMITEPGPNKILSEYTDTEVIESIKLRISISKNKHNSDLIALIGHYDCGANPAGEEVQVEQIKESMENIELWNTGMSILGLWVDSNWKVHEVASKNIAETVS